MIAHQPQRNWIMNIEQNSSSSIYTSSSPKILFCFVPCRACLNVPVSCVYGWAVFKNKEYTLYARMP